MDNRFYSAWKDGEYTYPAAFGFMPGFRTYLHDDEEVRPGVLVIPGGGYRMVVPTEGEIVAKRFMELGYQCFVGTYTTNLAGLATLGMQPLRDISRLMRRIRSLAGEFRLDPKRLFICGFSAGGHLCGSLAVHWQDVEEADPELARFSNRPDGAILSYPVITAGPWAHRDSFTALLGEDADPKALEYMSLETQVSEKTPPVFLWQTVTDELVPVQNTYLMAEALLKAGVSFEHHVFPRGAHGLSVSNGAWERGEDGEPYTMEQTTRLVEAVLDGRAEVAPEVRARLEMFAHPDPEAAPAWEHKALPEVSVWPELADRWMRGIEPEG